MSIELTRTNGKMLSISKDGKALRFMVPKNDIPYGFSEYVPPNGGPSSISLDVAITDTEKVREIIEIEHEVRKQLVGMHGLTEDDINTMFTSNFRNGRLRLKQSRSTRLFNPDGTPMDKVAKGGDFKRGQAACSATVASVYFMNRKVGLVWYADHIKIWEPQPEADLSEYAFRD